MLKQSAYRFRLEPTEEQETSLVRFSGSARYVWNKALGLQKELQKANGALLGFSGLCRELTAWKKDPETKWLQESPIHSLQQSIKDLDTAYKNAWRRVKQNKPVCFFKKSKGKIREATFEEKFGFPIFKKKGKRDSFRESDPACIKLEEGRIKLPKVGWIEFRQSRKIMGEIRNATVSRKGKYWFISIQTQEAMPDPVHSSDSAIGIDLGIAKFATMSNGFSVEPLNSFKKLEKKLAKEQRSLSRKVKFSNNWKKQKQAIEAVHIKISDARNDFLHKLSTTISKNHAVVVIEDLQVSNMSKSSKGDSLNHGKNVQAKSALNKSILDQGWFGFRSMLKYKLEWAGGDLKIVSPQYTSQKCSNCGHTEKENRKTQSRFLCQSCGHSENADVNAAKNILAVGHTVSACGDIRPIAA